jgi:hypothetical protein
MTRKQQIKKGGNSSSATVGGGGINSADNTHVSFRYEYFIIAGLCLAAAIRVFVFSAAFPFFNNVDEQSHFDMVMKYSKLHLPAAPMEKYDSQSVDIIARCASPEYFDVDIDKSPEAIAETVAYLKGRDNRETWVWPSYYLLAGQWCRFGELLGKTGIELLYWIRFFNVFLAAGFVWVSWLFCRRFFNDNFQKRIAIPLIAAFFPQDIFYAITGDVLSPSILGAAFLMLIEIHLDELESRHGWVYHLFAGLVTAGAFLTKPSNVAIVLLAAILVVIRVIRAIRHKRFNKCLPSEAVFICAAVIPVAMWLGRNYILFGDPVGSAALVKYQTLTVKPLSEVFNHPIFTPSGFIFFISELTKTFWRGEFIWRLKIIASPFMDQFYLISSALLIFVSIFNLARVNTSSNKPGRFARKAALFVLVASILFLIFLSMRYDFGICFNPSREKPYFTSGRLIAGTILPFLLLYVDGLYRILSRLRLSSILLPVVGVIAAAITISEIVITWPVFASPYNWFHLK